ncbi:MAG: hypothetical protein HQK57_02655 [Deltaproteobacteria bacterium]|nr:hypothetical protein [Deltaproteobacteria bacterium]MBF0507809.1 hypothetical protein [Deltaproteobacteria bacterium]
MASVSSLPIVVLTGYNDEELPIETLRLGGQDYLMKDQLQSRILIKAIRYATERKRVEQERLENLEREIRLLEQLNASSSATVTPPHQVPGPLRRRNSEEFAEITAGYAKILDLALDQRARKVALNLPDSIRILAERLGGLMAGPRDITEIHLSVLKSKMSDTPPSTGQAYVEEGRLLVFELMGYLASYYRTGLIEAGGDETPTQTG